MAIIQDIIWVSRVRVIDSLQFTKLQEQSQSSLINITKINSSTSVLTFYGKRSKKQQHDDNNNDGNDDKDSRTIPQIALGLVEEQCSELFLDQFGSPYAPVRINEHIETLPLKSSRFKNWLCRIFYRSEQDVLNNETVANILNILKARAEFDGNTRSLHLRVASIPAEEP